MEGATHSRCFAVLDARTLANCETSLEFVKPEFRTEVVLQGDGADDEKTLLFVQHCQLQVEEGGLVRL